MANLLSRIFMRLPSFITATGAGAVILNAASGYLTGEMGGREALYQGSMGVIGIGIRRALSKRTKDIKAEVAK